MVMAIIPSPIYTGFIDTDGNKTAVVRTLFYNIPSNSPQALFGQSGDSSTGTQGSILLTYNISAI